MSLPLGGVFVGSFLMACFQVKTLARRFALDGGCAMCPYPLGGVIGELRYHLVAVDAFGLALIDHLHHHLIWLHRGGGLRNVRETWVGCGLAVAIKAETVRRGWTFTRKQCRNCQWRGLKVCGPPRFFVGRGCRSPTWRLCGLPQSSSMFPSCL